MIFLYTGKRILSGVLALATCVSMLSAPASAAGSTQQEAAAAADDSTSSASAEFVVLSTTDVHGKCWDTNVLNDTTVNNSLLKVSTAVKSIREEYGDNVILIDNGDLYQGTPVSTYQISQLTTYLSTGSTDGLDENLIAEDGSFLTVNPMNICLEEIGYDAMVLGNHEFNYSWDTMQSLRADLSENGVETLTANLYNEDGTNAFKPYMTKELTVGDQTVTIGILGMTNTDCTRWDVEDNYPGLTFALDSVEEAQKYVDELEELGCDFIILAYHSGLGSGGTADEELVLGENTENQVLRVIQNTSGIDMVISGHDHSTGYSNNTNTNLDGEEGLAVNAGGASMTESGFTVTVDETGAVSIAQKSSENLNLANYDNDTELAAKLQAYADAADNYVNQDCGALVGDWDTVAQNACYLQQSDTMDLINRAQIAEGTAYIAEKYDTDEKVAELYEETGLDHLDIDLSASSVVFSGNYPASAGTLTMKGIYQFYKYDNTLYVITLTGAEIKEILEYVAENRLSVSIKNGEAVFSTIGDNFTNPIFYGLDFTYDMSKEAGDRVTITGFSNGREWTEDGVYLFAINNYHLGNGPFEDYSTEDAIWSQTDDLGGGVIQDLIAEYVAEATAENGGVSPEPSNWSIVYTAEIEDSGADLSNTTLIATRTDSVEDGDVIFIY